MSEPTARTRTLLAGRYRLQSVVGTGPCTTLWWALDEVLARPIAVKVLHAPSAVPRCVDAAEAITRFTTSAASVGKLAHPRIASTYDAGVDGDTPYIVTEWVDGEAVAAIVARGGPLTAAQAHTVALQTASALAYAHDAGIPHGQVDGFNVLLCADGNVKLTDFGVAAAIAPDAVRGRQNLNGQGAREDQVDPEDQDRQDQDRQEHQDHENVPDRPDRQDLGDELGERRSPAGQDVRAAAALLYLCLTGRSVYGDEPALPPAPRKDGVLLSPSQVRAGVPRELDLVVMRTLGDSRRTGPPITDSAELAAALDTIRQPEHAPVIDDDHTAIRVEPAEAHGSRLLRLGAPTLLAGVVVIAIAVAAFVGRPGTGGKAPDATRSGSKAPAAASTRSSAGSSAASAASSLPAGASAALPIASVRDFDPQGSPKSEDPKGVPRAHDGDPATGWETDRYKTASFGQLKAGVGLLFDLGAAVSVEQVAVQLGAGGTSLELRAADTPGQARDDFALVASAPNVGETATLRPEQATPHRYWLVWVTKLPAVPRGFRARLSEVAFTGLAAR